MVTAPADITAIPKASGKAETRRETEEWKEVPHDG